MHGNFLIPPLNTLQDLPPSISDWEFERDFEYNGLPEGAVQANLNFAGIDTVADIYLNGEMIQHCENMHITHTKDVTNLLKTGKNTLKVCIFAPEFYARKFPHTAFMVRIESIMSFQ